MTSPSVDSELSTESAPPLNQALLTRLRKVFRRNKDKPTKPKLTWKEKFRQLTVSQWFYALAMVVLIFSFEDNGNFQEDSLVSAGLLAGIGLSREMWNLFHKIWHTTLGKGVFLVMYAATANFALAIAALKVNAIVGIEPLPLKFTLGFTTLIMLPMWVFVASVFFTVCILMVGNVWVAIALLLRLVRVRLPVHWEDRSFATLTMFMRLILLPMVIVAMFEFIKPYAEQLYVFEEPLEIVKSNMTPEQAQALKAAEGAERAALLKEYQDSGAVSIERLGEDEEAEKPKGPGPIDKMIAGFVYQFETYARSKCAKQPDERVLPIDEYAMLVVKRSDNEVGYEFDVKPCVLKYDAKPQPLPEPEVDTPDEATPAQEPETETTAQ